ncbi:MAG: FecR family protein, partial [Gammaproteobacteria bacterium]
MTTAHDPWLDEPPELPPADVAAARWLARLTSGDTTAQERAEFRRWLDADPAHAAALSALRRLWVAAGPSLETRPQLQRPTRRLRRHQRWALAASLVLGIAVAAQAVPHALHDAVTGTGERRAVQLADGSRVLLNSGTGVEIDFDGNERRITLAHGEAWFEVAEDRSRPFVVRSGNAEVRVLGTRFAVKHAGKDMRVTVEKGRVEVRRGGDSAVLQTGQRLRTQGDALGPVEAAGTMPELAWRNGRLILEDASLERIAAALRPHFRGALLVTGSPTRRFNAVIDLER